MEDYDKINNTIDEEEEKEMYINNITNTISDEDIIKFIYKVENKNEIKIEDFNLYHKIKKNNEISPLMLYILQESIKKYNDFSVNNGIIDTGFAQFPGLTDKEIENNKIYFNSSNSFVLYSTFSEEFIGKFWSNHQLLSELLGINPIEQVISTSLKLAKSCSETKSSKSNKKSKKSNEENDEQKKLRESNNNEYYKLSLGASFEYNALHYLLYGINEFINLPRIIFYPIVEYMEYEEIDTAILIKKMKSDIKEHFKNFKSIDLYNANQDIRKEFELKENDIVFVETTFDIEKKNKISDFMNKIVKFISLYINAGLINSLDDYKIKPLVLYNNNYYLRDKIIQDIKDDIESFKISISKLNSNQEKFEEIYKNIQIIYCWPTIPIVNNFYSSRDLNTKIDELKNENEEKMNEIQKQNEEKMNELQKKNDEKINELQKENDEKINELKNQNKALLNKINNLLKEICISKNENNRYSNKYQRFKNNFYNNHKNNNNYKFNNNNYKFNNNYYKYNNNNYYNNNYKYNNNNYYNNNYKYRNDNIFNNNYKYNNKI